MLAATALPMKGFACSNQPMLQGKELAKALKEAMDKLRALPGYERWGPTKLGEALSMSQPAASELLQTGRLAKDKYLKLVEIFKDVVGPEHWGLPYTSEEMRLLSDIRELPSTLREQLLMRISTEAQKYRSEQSKMLATLFDDRAPESRKRLKPGA